MSTIEAVIKFMGAYPAWAKLAMLAGLAVTFGVAILAPRSPIDAEAQAKSKANFKILGVNASALPDGAMVRVTAIINGKAYTYPSLAGVDWLVVGPTMSSQTFALPDAKAYEVRFEMELKKDGAGAITRYASQETVTVQKIPHTDQYRMYPLKSEAGGVSRAAVPGATVKYAIEASS